MQRTCGASTRYTVYQIDRRVKSLDSCRSLGRVFRMGLTREEALRILGLEDGCSNRDIRERFKKLALKWHPDKNFHNPEEAQKKFQAISAGYTRLVASDETDDEISTETLGEMFAEIWEVHNKGHRTYDPSAHLFCDCEICQGEWKGMDYTDILGSDSDMDEDLYYGLEDRMYADSLLKDFAEKLYRNYNGPGRVARKSKTSMGLWSSSVYRRKHITAEEATRNADELLKAEEEEKKQAEKRRTKNKKKKESRKRRKAKQCNGSGDGGGGRDTHVGQKEGSDQDDSESENDNELDITSAFIARASKKQTQQMTKGTSSPGLSHGTSGPSHGTSGPSHGTSGPSHGTSGPSQQDISQPTQEKQIIETKIQQCESSSESDIPIVNGHPTSTNEHIAPAVPAANTRHTINISEASTYEPNLGRSRQLAGQGNKAAKDGRFEEAVRKYTEAIELYPFDHRYFGNRSFCYDYLHDYKNALEDACAALHLDPSWPKGYYRKGRALAGVKRYEAAEAAYTKAIQLDPNYKDAEEELLKIQVDQLTNMGFAPSTSKAAIKEQKTVQAAVDAILAGNVNNLKLQHPTATSVPQPYVPVYNSSGYEMPPRMLAQQQPQDANTQGRALWVGNINSETITDEMLNDLFKQYGEMQSVRTLPDRHCAFVNYSRPEYAAQALKALQGYHIGGCYLLLRYPENPVKGGGNRTVKKSGPVNGDECYFWRTTGCSFGGTCHYKHIPASKGIDLTDGMLRGLNKY